MKFLTIAALFGMITAEDVTSNETEAWTRVSTSHMRAVCPRLRVKLALANQYIARVPMSTPAQKGAPELMEAQSALDRCQWNGTFYQCNPRDEAIIMTKLMSARIKIGMLSRRNTSSWLELAFNRAYWAREYASRCINGQYVLNEEDQLPEELAEQQLLDSILENEDDDETNLIRMTFSDNGKRVASEAQDVANAFKALENDPNVKKIGNAMKDLETTPEAKALGAHHKKFQDSDLGKQFFKEIRDAAKKTADSIEKTTNPNGFYLDNKKIPGLEAEWKQVKELGANVEKNGWTKGYKDGFENLAKTKQAGSLKAAIDEFKKTPKAQHLKKSIEELNKAGKETHRISDLPKGGDNKKVKDLINELGSEDELKFIF